MVLEMAVDESPLVRVHRRELRCAPALHDPNSCFFRFRDHPEVPGREKPIDIHSHPGGVKQVPLYDPVEEMGEFLKSLSIPPDEQRSFMRNDMQGVIVWVRSDFDDEAKIPQQGVESLLSQIERIHRSIK